MLFQQVLRNYRSKENSIYTDGTYQSSRIYIVYIVLTM